MKKNLLEKIKIEKEKSLKKIKSATYKVDENFVNAIEKISKHNKISKNKLLELMCIETEIIKIADEIKDNIHTKPSTNDVKKDENVIRNNNNSSSFFDRKL